MTTLQTTHRIVIGAAQRMEQIEAATIALVVTSPPYPMIEMWDEIMANQNDAIREAMAAKKGNEAFELMHVELDKVWAEIERVLIPGGFACINIGDATRSIGNEFALYPNHSRIISAFHRLGMVNLPNILWRKQTNAPNKFMGSGMLPAGAYVTLEHEWILIFRKAGKRIFKTEEEKQRRRESAFFWEERNVWFSDNWDLKGTKQKMDSSTTRSRSAAYPFEIPYRLINMYSVQGDMVLDPFLGTGTTSLAAMATNRNSIGYEIDPRLLDTIMQNLHSASPNFFNTLLTNRLKKHQAFIAERQNDKKETEIKHFNAFLNTPVLTSQETDIQWHKLEGIEKIDCNELRVSYL